MRIYHEITNVCNRHCAFCPGTKRDPAFISPERFAERLEKTRSFSDEITFHVMGEPLLHPEFESLSRIARSNGVPVNLTTNGTLLDESKKKFLLENPIFRQINFSIHGLTDQEDSILENILEFCKQANAKRPELYLNLRLWNLEDDFSGETQNRHKLDKIFRALNPEFSGEFHFSGGRKSRRITGRIYLNCDTVFQWPEYCSDASEATPAFCHGLELQAAVLVDGTVVPCCLDSEGRVDLGNIDRESMTSIMGSERVKKILSGFQNGIAEEPLCRKCTFRRRFK